MYVCLCLGISDKKIKELAESGESISDIQRICAVGTSCGTCIPELKRLVGKK